MKFGRVALSLLVLLAAACDRSPEPAAKPAPAPLVERAGPIRWNAQAGVFEAGGQPIRTARLWTFDGSTDGWTGQRSAVIPGDPQGLEVTLADPTLRSPRGLQVQGAQFPLVIVRLTRLSAGQAWDGSLYYSTTTHGEGGGWQGRPVDNVAPQVGETITLVYDMSRQATGAPDWSASVIEQLRLDVEAKAGGRFLVRQVAVAEPIPSLGLGVSAAPVLDAPPAVMLRPIPADLRRQLDAARPAPGCKVDGATLAPVGQDVALQLAGAISELAAVNPSPIGWARLQGPGVDLIAPISVDRPRPDVQGPPAAQAAGFGEAFGVIGLAPGAYNATVYRRGTAGWLACRAPGTVSRP